MTHAMDTHDSVPSSKLNPTYHDIETDGGYSPERMYEVPLKQKDSTRFKRNNSKKKNESQRYSKPQDSEDEGRIRRPCMEKRQ
jgi:hypothetical protein